MRKVPTRDFFLSETKVSNSISVCSERRAADSRNRRDLQSRAAERLHFRRIVKSHDSQSRRDAAVESHVASIPASCIAPFTPPPHLVPFVYVGSVTTGAGNFSWKKAFPSPIGVRNIFVPPRRAVHPQPNPVVLLGRIARGRNEGVDIYSDGRRPTECSGDQREANSGRGMKRRHQGSRE